MLDFLSHWTETLRSRRHSDAMEKQVLELASTLGEHPENRCAYQRLLDAHLASVRTPMPPVAAAHDAVR